jgi:hypothetical protein
MPLYVHLHINILGIYSHHSSYSAFNDRKYVLLFGIQGHLKEHNDLHNQMYMLIVLTLTLRLSRVSDYVLPRCRRYSHLKISKKSNLFFIIIFDYIILSLFKMALTFL